MNTHLPEDLECFMHANVNSGRFTLSDEALRRILRRSARRIPRAFGAA
jgi:Arc/MetJ-type ribon-helix-helix transcriptional regulator